MRLSSHVFPVCWALGLASCAAPKAIIVTEENGRPAPLSARPPPQNKGNAATSEEPILPGPVDDGIRLPDVLGLPADSDFRPANPASPKTGADAGAVIARPPLDPPSRPKPKEKTAE